MLDVAGIHDLASAKAASRDCEFCGGDGLAPIFHIDYDGRPYLDDLDQDGRPRRRITRTTAYCVCAAGRWIMMTHQTDSKAIFHRIMDLHSVINQESLWSAKDPVEPKYDPSEVPGWRSFREMAAEIGSKMKRSAKTPEERHKERESWLIRLLVHTLRDGPTKFSQILESAAYSGRGDVQAIRRVGDILGVHVERRGDDEIWSISRE